jgi:hypothetical protein
VRRPPSDVEREQAAELLQRACGDGRLTLEEFGVRVGSVWAAENRDDLARATSGLASAPIVGAARTVDSILTVFSENKRRGRWRMRAGRLWARTVFGSTELDLREVLTDAGVLEITGFCLFGRLTVIVPEGVEVDLTGATVFASRQLHLAPVPRVPGTPEVRVDVAAWFSQIEVTSHPYELPPS